MNCKLRVQKSICPGVRNASGKGAEMEGEWYVTLSFAAEELKCRRSDIYNLISMGILNFIEMPGKEIKISSASLENLAGHSYEGFLPGSF
jgi:hypothetical protein